MKRNMCDLFLNKVILTNSITLFMLKICLLLSIGIFKGNKACSSVENLFILTNLLLLTIGIPKAQTSCPSENSTEKCLSGFRNIKGVCTACIGFVGTDCGHPCPPGYYGRLCKSPCNCSKTENCNRFVGCISTGNTTGRDNERMRECCKNDKNCSLGELLNTCIIWQVAVGLVGIQVLELIALIGYLLRRKMTWSRNLEINVTETVGHFRMKKDDSIADEIIEKEECKSIKYDSHLLKRNETNGDKGDLYNHIHFKRVANVQNSSDKYDVILKQSQRRKDHETEPRDVSKTFHIPDSASNRNDTENQGIYKLDSNV